MSGAFRLLLNLMVARRECAHSAPYRMERGQKRMSFGFRKRRRVFLFLHETTRECAVQNLFGQFERQLSN